MLFRSVAIFLDATIVIKICTHDEPSHEQLADLKTSTEEADSFKVALATDGSLDIRKTVKLNVIARAEELGFPDYLRMVIT